VFDPLFDIAMVLMTFTGGLGTLAGPVLGALLIEPAHEYFTVQYGASGLYLILYGGLFLAVILLLPQGIIPSLRLFVQRQRTRRSRSAAAAETSRAADGVAPGTGRAVKP
jgi:branched-chain amino acid transport system permease protein